jgi:hypothetical protein
VSVLDEQVHAGGQTKPFGQMTAAEVVARATELRTIGAGGGPLTRVVPVAQAWSELGRLMASAGAATVAELGEEAAAEYAARLWIVTPGGTLLPSSDAGGAGRSS